MDLILLQKVKNLGNLGDKVRVKPGYGRNYLVPQGKAASAVAALPYSVVLSSTLPGLTTVTSVVNAFRPECASCGSTMASTSPVSASTASSARTFPCTS